MASKNFKLVWRCHQLLFEFLAIGYLPGVTSVGYKGDNEMISGTVHRYPGMYLTDEENSQLRDSLIKAVRPVIASNGILTSK